jgi:hypothetical protein
VRVDCETDEVTELAPARLALEIKPPEAFGDNWSDPLEDSDLPIIERYFREREHLAKHFGFIEISAGGRRHTVLLNPELKDRGITFEAPRHSLMTCLEWQIFDDMLIGNYMKTTLHGVESLYPDFSPYVAKFADNGGAKSERDLGVYFHHYQMRDPIGLLMTRFATASEQWVRTCFGDDTRAFRAAKRIYYSLAARR